MSFVVRLVPALLAGSILFGVEGQQKAWARPLLGQSAAPMCKPIYFVVSLTFFPAACTR